MGGKCNENLGTASTMHTAIARAIVDGLSREAAAPCGLGGGLDGRGRDPGVDALERSVDATVPRVAGHLPRQNGDRQIERDESAGKQSGESSSSSVGGRRVEMAIATGVAGRRGQARLPEPHALVRALVGEVVVPIGRSVVQTSARQPVTS